MSNRLKKLHSILETTPEDVFINYCIGLEYLKMDDLLLAKQFFLNCIRFDSTYLPAFHQIVEVFSKLNDPVLFDDYKSQALSLAKTLNDFKTVNEISLIEYHE